MVFLSIAVPCVFLWWLISRDHRILSASFAGLAGTLLFVGLGVEFMRYDDLFLSIVIVIVFYFFLVLGQRLARFVPITKQAANAVGSGLAGQKPIRWAFMMLFVLYPFLPVLEVLLSGRSITEIFATTWASNVLAQRSQEIIALSHLNLTGGAALIAGLQGQLSGFWYLSVGIAYAMRSRLLYPVLLVFVFGTLLTSGGSRTNVMIAALLPLLLLASSISFRRPAVIVASALVGLALLLSMDVLLQGRAGATVAGSLPNRVQRVLQTDFAYGGLGLQVGMATAPDPLGRGADYLIRTAVLPIPRVLWPGKPTSNPNQELTEAYTGQYLETYGTMLLFTPLGEALFYFGFLGLLVIPILYGLTTGLLERLYATSSSYKGLLIQVYIWTFLGMRLTYFNVFSILVAADFVMLALLALCIILWQVKSYRRMAAATQIAS